MPRGKAHPPEIRARAVAEMVTGCTVPDVCERYGLPDQTARDWLADALSSGFAREPGGARDIARQDLSDLVTILVEEVVITLTDQSRFARNVDWLSRQDASGLAAYRGTDLDRLIRLLPAFRRPEPATIDGTVIDGERTE